MKTIPWILVLVLLMLTSGCSSPESVSEMQGKGTRAVFNADYDRVWSASVAAAQTDDLYILNANKGRGYISTKRGWRPTTWGENVGIWIRSKSPTQTEVEVLSKQAGPPILTIQNWEEPLLGKIARNLSTTTSAQNSQTDR